MINFDAPTHTYSVNGVRLASVGEVVKRYKKPFESNYWAAAKARQRGVEPEVVLAEWKAKGDRAKEAGTALHQFVSDVLDGKRTRAAKSQQPLQLAWSKWWFGGAGENLKPLGREVMLWSVELGVAGTADLVARSRKTGRLHVFDWKTNGEFRTENKYGDAMLSPFDDLPDCHLSEYSMQVELYRLLAEAIYGEEFGDSWVVHVGEVATPYRTVALRDRWKDVFGVCA